MSNILVIPDTQVKPDVPLNHLVVLSKFIMDRKPDKIVHIGDHFDLPSLSVYDVGKRDMEGRRLDEDIAAGNYGLDLITLDMRRYNNLRKANKKKLYSPEMYFLMGNHEDRLQRHIDAHPQLEGVLNYDLFNLHDWTVVPYLEVLELEDIMFSHYFYNPMTGKSIGGTVQNRLAKLQKSFVQGHEQQFIYGSMLTLDGLHHGLVAGAFYMHDEKYKGPQGNPHWRGICMLNNAHNGTYDLETISLTTLLEAYGG